MDPHTRKRWQLLTNNMELKDSEIVEIYRRRWQIETQIWVVMIANLLVKLVKAQVNRMWSFSNLVSLLRHSLGYYYDLVPFLENPERVAASSFVGGRSPPGQLQLNLV
ncbi:hypothetical protein [Hallerella succinigenes]|uniref:hypothetical protein n=1 Tax=Hallerella succinigenes TaxID=1896222 RepID=UPI0023F2FB92|nr:hypothetical protein [Hallerella succinigenes]